MPSIPTGEEIDSDIVSDVLAAPNIGNEKYEAFVKERLVDGSKSIFIKIKKTKIKYERAKTKRLPQENSVLKEDLAAFELIISKSINLETAFKYPITSLPLSLLQNQIPFQGPHQNLYYETF